MGVFDVFKIVQMVPNHAMWTNQDMKPKIPLLTSNSELQVDVPDKMNVMDFLTL